MDGLVYGFHGLFWSAFLVRVPRRRKSEETSAGAAPAASAAPARTARHPLLLLLVHGLGFGFMYNGMGQSVSSPAPPARLFPGPWIAGAALISLGAALFA